MNFHQKPITFVHQVNLKVQSLTHALDFYQHVIGFKILEKNDTSAHLTADGKTVLLSIYQPEKVVPKSSRTTGLYHFALLLPNRSDLASIVDHFAKIDLQLGAADHLVSEALYLSDPDGNGIEIYVDRDSSNWKWNNGEVAMTTDPLNVADLLSKEKGSWKGLPSGTKMGHIHLHVSDLKKAEEFYVKGLGFNVVNRYGNQALFISDGKYHHYIGLNTWNGVGAPAPSANSVGLESYGLLVANEEKRNNIIAQIKQIGAPVYEKNGKVITVDPAGNRISLDI
ncbi:VOC family protein [Pseudogracilibacillus sp. SE30717A]|uniref:VOC family protein n=1 Tax=Pseudogracilibacillus sp. SE30717A TaxID=3098293 RepID=UPI00300DDA5D